MSAPPSYSTVPGRLAQCARERPAEIAHIVLGSPALTFAQWHDEANNAAGALAERGITLGDRVVVEAHRSGLREYIIAYAATQLAGATPVVVPESMGTDRRAQAARSAGAVGVVGPAAIGDLPRWTYAELAEGGALPFNHRNSPEAEIISPEAEIIFTSGTTGTPKGVVATHSNVLATHSAKHPDIASHVTVLHSIAPGSIGAQGLLVQPLDPWPHMVVTLPSWDADAFLSAIDRHRANHLVLVPAQAADLLAAPPGLRDLSSVGVVRTISAACPRAVLAGLQELFPDADIITMYTSTEAFPARLRLSFDPARPESVGRAADARGTQVRVVDDAGQEVPPNTIGHVHLRSNGAARRHYDGDDQANAAVFLTDGWIATGDLGELDRQGYLTLHGRDGDVLNAGGTMMSPLAAESVLREVPGVVDAAVFGVPHPTLGTLSIAAIVQGPGLSLDALDADLAERLGAAAPQRLWLVPDLHRNEMGKVVKSALRDQYLAAHGDATAAEPATPTQVTIADIWKAVLGVAQVGPASNFFDLGGSSLSATQVIAEVIARLGRVAGVGALYRADDLAAFAASVDAGPLIDSPPVPIRPVPRVPATPSGDVPA